MTPEQQILQRNKEVFALAEKLYNVDMSKVQIRFDLKGRIAGQARRTGGVYIVRYNRDMIQREFQEQHDVTVPHEVAHIVCFMRPMLGRDHDHGWRTVDRALGGTGARTHDMDIVYGKGLTYEYTTTTGKTLRLSERIHRSIQAGTPRIFRKGYGTVNNSCAHSIVGQGGRSFAQPIVRIAAEDVTHSPVSGTIALIRVPAPTRLVITERVQIPKIAPVFAAGLSKASIARSIMLSGHTGGKCYEEIIQAIMQATGHDRQLSRSYYKGNYAKVGVPAPQ